MPPHMREALTWSAIGGGTCTASLTNRGAKDSRHQKERVQMCRALTIGFVLMVSGLGACRDDKPAATPAPKPVAGEEAQGDTRAPVRGETDKGMHGNMKGMHGMGSGDMAGMMTGMCAHMMGGAQTTVENTADGAVIRMTATNADGVAKVQNMATMMRDCMNSPKQDAAPKP